MHARYLQHFVALVELVVCAAAKNPFICQPGLSDIKRLESFLGVNIFDRRCKAG